MTSWFRGEGYDPRDDCPDNCSCSGCCLERNLDTMGVEYDHYDIELEWRDV